MLTHRSCECQSRQCIADVDHHVEPASIGREKGAASMAMRCHHSPAAKHGPRWDDGPLRAGPPLPLKFNQPTCLLGDQPVLPPSAALKPSVPPRAFPLSFPSSCSTKPTVIPQKCTASVDLVVRCLSIYPIYPSCFISCLISCLIPLCDHLLL